ncbi:Nuclear cap-binding protein subunit 2 [Trichoplax sp. H2]|nr:Nuclear cap-binding protein subunit 2 [Trichoplax sp. H2]|eukprot:RDD40905.1 Nuclear cap-binding protein subunit 2 [Trichoplax sp. H2]
MASSIEAAVDSVSLSAYRDQQFKGTVTEQESKLKLTCTMYVGNLSFYTTESQLYEVFSKVGDVKRILTYDTREEAEMCMRYINGTKIDDRIIRTDWDAGFIEGRQYGRGRSGGQVRDECRQDFDANRGGFGQLLAKGGFSETSSLHH